MPPSLLPAAKVVPEHYLDKMVPCDAQTYSQIRGNASEDTKKFCWGMSKYFVGQPHWFSSRIGHSARLVEVNVWGADSKSDCSPSTSGKDSPARAETVFEVVVTQEMCNLFGILHGACATYLIDHCSVSSLIALGYCVGKDGTGLSQSMNIIWNEAAPLGTTLRIVNTSMVIRGRVRICRSELWNGSRLCVSGVHSLVNAPHKMMEPGCNASSGLGEPEVAPRSESQRRPRLRGRLYNPSSSNETMLAAKL